MVVYYTIGMLQQDLVLLIVFQAVYKAFVLLVGMCQVNKNGFNFQTIYIINTHI